MSELGVLVLEVLVEVGIADDAAVDCESTAVDCKFGVCVGVDHPATLVATPGLEVGVAVLDTGVGLTVLDTGGIFV